MHECICAYSWFHPGKSNRFKLSQFGTHNCLLGCSLVTFIVMSHAIFCIHVQKANPNWPSDCMGWLKQWQRKKNICISLYRFNRIMWIHTPRHFAAFSTLIYSCISLFRKNDNLSSTKNYKQKTFNLAQRSPLRTFALQFH